MTSAYVVESVIANDKGERIGIARVYVANEARAIEVAGLAPGRTYRELSLDEMPPAARENMLRAAAEG